jgi:hypothetical protein
MFVSSLASGESSFATFAVPLPFLNPRFMSPSKSSTSLPSISRVGTSFSRLPYLIVPSVVWKRIRRSNVDILNVVVVKVARVVLVCVLLVRFAVRIIYALLNAERMDGTERKPAVFVNMREEGRRSMQSSRILVVGGSKSAPRPSTAGQAHLRSRVFGVRTRGRASGYKVRGDPGGSRG